MNETPTRHEDVNAVVLRLLGESRRVLGDGLLAMYLHGSLATGDFDEARSDIDFIVVLDEAPSDETVSELSAMHGELLRSGSKWAKRLEGSFVQRDWLKSAAPPKTPRPYMNGPDFHVWPYGNEWVLETHLIRERGIVVVGPPPTTFIPPVSSEQIRSAIVAILREDWAPLLRESSRLADEEYQAYAVLTMCRCLFTLAHRRLASKKAAAKWVQEAYGEWKSLIAAALDWTDGRAFHRRVEVEGFIRFTIEHATDERRRLP